MARRIQSRVLDLSGGIIGGISDYGRRVRHVRVLENLLLRPYGALGVRKGSQRFTSDTLASKPHSCMEWVSSAGVGSIFVGSEGSPGFLFAVSPTAYTQQITPQPLGNANKFVWDQLHGALWVAEQGSARSPIFYRSTNPANTFHTGILPRPAFPAIASGTTISGSGIPGGDTVNGAVAAGDTTLILQVAATATAVVTLIIGSGNAAFSLPNCQTTNTSTTVRYNPASAAAGTQMTLAQAVGGNLTLLTQYFYRLRYRFLDGSSRATTNTHSFTLTGGNNQINITTIANEIRSDYVGWTLERTKAGGTAAGPFYFLADSAGTTDTDVTADADLGYRSDENNHGEPPHFEGILAYKDRLIAWVGSTIYFSQSVGDIEATGIANWNALNASDIGPDDGDTISAIVLQVDRLVVLKRWSVWCVEGDDISSFRAFPLFKGAGCSGPRAAASIGSTIYFWGEAGFHRISGNTVGPFGWLEVGHLFDTFRPGQYADVVVRNYLGQYILLSYASSSSTNDDMLVYDQRFGAWSRITGWFWNDLLIQKAGTFGDARTIVAVDRRDLNPAAGFDYPIWLGFFGFKDEKTSSGSGGSEPNVVLETPKTDDGAPDQDKDWELLQVFMSGTNVSASATLLVDSGITVSISLQASQSGAVWAAATWGAFTWATASDSAPFIGLRAGTVGRRYSLRIVSKPTAEFTFSGYVLDGILQPKPDYSRS